MADGFAKILQLLKQTRGSMIVVDQAGQPLYVAVSFDEYDRLLASSRNVKGLTEDQLLEQINRDIAEWKNLQEVAAEDNWTALDEIIESKRETVSSESEENSLKQDKIEDPKDQYYFEPIE